MSERIMLNEMNVAKINIEQLLPSKYYLNNQLKFYFILSGRAILTHNGNKISLKIGDIYVVGDGDIVQHVEQEQLRCLAITVPLQLQMSYPTLPRIYRAYSVFYYSELYEQMAKTMAAIYVEYSYKQKGHMAIITGYIHTLIGLQQRAMHEKSVSQTFSKPVNEKIAQIMSYMNENYDSRLLLDDVARMFYVSKYYLAHEFKEQNGLTFGQYLKEIRTFHAIRDLQRHEGTLLEFALKHGFPNVRALNEAFKEKYNALPSELRNQIALDNSHRTDAELDDVEQLDILLQYIDKNQYAAPKLTHRKSIQATINAAETQTKQGEKLLFLKKSFKQPELLRGVKQDLAINYVAVSNMVSLIKFRNEGTQKQLDFTFLDERLKLCISYGLIPYLQLSTTDYEAWRKFEHMMPFTTMLDKIKRHIQIEYYEVTSWYIEFRCYYEAQENSRLCEPLVHAISIFYCLLRIVVHFPIMPTLASTVDKSEIETIYCLDDLTTVSFLGLEEVKHYLLDPKFIDVIRENRNVAKQHALLDAIHDYTEDQYLAKYAELAQANLALWLHFYSRSSMIITPVSLDTTIIFDNFPEQLAQFVSLYTKEGLVKESYHAYRFLSLLYRDIVYEDEHCIVTKYGQHYTLLVFYPQEDFMNVLSPSLTNNVTTKFSEVKVPFLDIHLTLLNIEGDYRITKQEITPQIIDRRTMNSSYKEMDYMTSEDKLYYNSINKPNRSIEFIHLEGQYEFDIELPVLGILLVQLEQI